MLQAFGRLGSKVHIMKSERNAIAQVAEAK